MLLGFTYEVKIVNYTLDIDLCDRNCMWNFWEIMSQES